MNSLGRQAIRFALLEGKATECIRSSSYPVSRFAGWAMQFPMCPEDCIQQWAGL